MFFKNKREIERLRAEVDELRSRLYAVEDASKVYLSESNPLRRLAGMYSDWPSVPVSDVVRALADHVGVRVVRRENTDHRKFTLAPIPTVSATPPNPRTEP